MSEHSRSHVRPVKFEDVITERQPALSRDMQKPEARVHPCSNDRPSTLTERDREHIIEHRADRCGSVARFRGPDQPPERGRGSHDERAPMIRYSVAAYAQLRAAIPDKIGAARPRFRRHDVEERLSICDFFPEGSCICRMQAERLEFCARNLAGYVKPLARVKDGSELPLAYGASAMRR
jgi:hypothetical protein